MKISGCTGQLLVEVIIQVEGSSAGERLVMFEGFGG